MSAGNGHLEIMQKIKAHLGECSSVERLVDGFNEVLNSPLHWATLNNQLPCLAFLIESKANAGLKNAENQTPLDMALDLGHYEAAVK